MNPLAPLPAGFTLRHDLVAGDLGRIVAFHGIIYAQEYGFDQTFEAYVAAGLAEFACARAEGSRLWLAERDGTIAGCIAIVGINERESQLRWYLVDPATRGLGLGRKLLHQAIDFCRARGYESIFLWTVSALTAASRLYRSVGFEKVEEKPGKPWGVEVVEEKYFLSLGPSGM